MTQPSKFRVPKRMHDDIIEHALRLAPSECVGVVACRETDEVAVIRIEAENRSPTPQTHFYVEPFDQFRIEEALREEGHEITAIYHSHIQSPAYPSGADRLFSGNRLMVIVSLDTTPPHMRAWHLDDPESEPVEVEVEVLDSIPV